MTDNTAPLILHATSVAVMGKGVLILGASGAGKSSLALELMGYGAQLIADDRTVIAPQDQSLVLSAPDNLFGRIEARGIGILNATPSPPAPLCTVVDLDQKETDRLPPFRETTLLGLTFPLLRATGSLSFAAAVMQYLKSGRNA